MDYNFDDAVFTYFVSSQKHRKFKCYKEFSSRKILVSHTEGTNVYITKDNMKSICIIGLCVDAYAEIERHDLPEFLLRSDGIRNLLKKTTRLAGRYVIIYEDSESLYAFTDAVGMLSIYYSSEEEICFSSCDEIARNHSGYEITMEHLDIVLNMLDPSERLMPKDITLSEPVKILLANHYLDLNNKQTVRYFPTQDYTPSLSKEDKKSRYNKMIERHIKLVDNITKEYAKYYDIVCPITSGYDSRLNMSFLERNIKNLVCYTFIHKNFTETTGDLYIPVELCKKTNLELVQIPDVHVTDSFYQEVCNVIGDYHSRFTINLGQTFNSMFKGKALITGCVSEYVGKLSWGDWIPLYLTDNNYFVKKYKNKSIYLFDYVRKHIDELKSIKICDFIHDLFGIEAKICQWSSQASMIYGVLGISGLNLFNCREIIEDWTNVSRRFRKKKLLHYSFIRNVNNELLSFPFNPNDPAVKKSIYYRVAVYVLTKPFLLLLYWHIVFLKGKIIRKNTKAYDR